jgi:hypothetical protein
VVSCRQVVIISRKSWSLKEKRGRAGREDVRGDGDVNMRAKYWCYSIKRGIGRRGHESGPAGFVLFAGR